MVRSLSIALLGIMAAAGCRGPKRWITSNDRVRMLTDLYQRAVFDQAR